jgi:signal transduction histidine kinase
MIRVLLIAPYQELVDPFTALFAEHAAKSLSAEYANESFTLSSVVVTRIKDLKSLKFDAEVIVSRGYVASEVRRLNFYVPIVEIPIASIDLLTALLQVKKQYGSVRTVAIGSDVMMMTVDRILDFAPLDFLAVDAGPTDQIRETVTRAAAEGFKAVVGGAVACETAERLGLGSVLLESGRESIWHSITEAKRLAYLVRQERERMEHFSGLVAGVAHEVNTPLGVSVSAASHVKNSLLAVKTGYVDGSMDEDAFLAALDSARESAEIIERNLEKAAEFIRTFKQIAADQAVEDRRLIVDPIVNT